MVAQVLDLDQAAAIIAKLDVTQNQSKTQHNIKLTIQFKKITLSQQQTPVNVIQQYVGWCGICDSLEHVTKYYKANQESVNYVGNAQSGRTQNYGSTYNPI